MSEKLSSLPLSVSLPENARFYATDPTEPVPINRSRAVELSAMREILSTPRQAVFVIDGGGSVIDTGEANASLIIPTDGEFLSVTLLAGQLGSIVLDIWKSDYTNYPPNAGGSIVGANPPMITADIKSTDSLLTGWDKDIQGGDIFKVSVTSVSSIQYLTVVLEYKTH